MGTKNKLLAAHKCVVMAEEKAIKAAFEFCRAAVAYKPNDWTLPSYQPGLRFGDARAAFVAADDALTAAREAYTATATATAQSEEGQ